MIPLVAAAHGTRDGAGLAATAELLDLVRALRPGLRVEVGYVDVAEPLLSETLGRLSGEVVVVPLLLGAGYHVRRDIPAALAAAPQVSARVAAALGPDPRLADILLDRLTDAGALGTLGTPEALGTSGARRPQPVDKRVEKVEIVDNSVCDAIVLAAAGSTDASANADTARMAELLADLTGRTVVPSYLCAGSPTPQAAVDALRASGADHIALAGYLLGPGHFARKAAAAGATTTTAPLGAHPTLARLVLERYDAAVASPASCAASTSGEGQPSVL